jgi:hypothetical protein
MDPNGQIYFGAEDEIPVADRLRLDEAQKLEALRQREELKQQYLEELKQQLDKLAQTNGAPLDQ